MLFSSKQSLDRGVRTPHLAHFSDTIDNTNPVVTSGEISGITAIDSESTPITVAEIVHSLQQQPYTMKVLTTNFLTCAVKACKSSPASYPLHFKDASLERTEIDFNPLFIRNILPRVNWDALKGTASELGLGAMVPEVNPVEFEATEDKQQQQEVIADEMETDGEEDDAVAKTEEGGKEVEVDDEILRKLHTLLLETAVMEGKLVCGNCGFEYPIKEGVGNFLLPAHLV